MSHKLPAILPSNGGELNLVSGSQRIATRMAENLLTQARSQERALAAQRRYRIGDYEFREADYFQIQRWERKLGSAPEKLVEGLAGSEKRTTLNLGGHTKFHVQDGSIVSMVWDFSLFPLTDWGWLADVEIARLVILEASGQTLPDLPGKLRELDCSNNDITCLNLDGVPELKRLSCSSNKLTKLDLRPVPRLQWLNLSQNKLSELDLTLVSELKRLGCCFIQLIELDLAPVPMLQWLNCGGNM
jgi:Leucine Rich repeats (2 copies)